MPAFIETQFPIARLSAESYKERKAGASQTLTGLGKWWGRKPLILVRASILGMLMPASSDPKRDREIFLKILTMDDDGTVQRWKSNERYTLTELLELASPDERNRYHELLAERERLFNKINEVTEELKRIPKGNLEAIANATTAMNDAVGQADRARKALLACFNALQITVFNRLPYAERLKVCERPENIDGPTAQAWEEINAHLGTMASNLAELIEQLGLRSYGHTPRVGDCFCGGGSIPFEAARIGCEAFGSDLNPVAGLLTWASLNLLGGGKKVQDEVRGVQEEVFAAADKQITEWGIEHNEQGERAEAFLYCVEVKPEGCDYYIPLAPSWVIAEKYRIVATWKKLPDSLHLQPEVVAVSESELKLYKGGKGATVVDSRIVDPFDATRSWSVEALRGPEGLRRWSNDDVVPRPGDVFQERLYCIRWAKTVIHNGKPKLVRRYAAPDAADLAREAKVLALLRERFADWQREGFIPSKAIVSGYNTEQPIRERGWTHWHHLFTPRQLLTHGLFLQEAHSRPTNKYLFAASALGAVSCSNWNSKLCQWTPQLARSGGIGAFAQTFYNQALNTLFNWGNRPLTGLHDFFAFKNVDMDVCFDNSIAIVADARDLRETCDFWITDPPYADAINYHELGDFFLAWYDKQLARAFPEWTTDARAELAVRGDGEDFRRSMVEIYKNLARHMPDNGMQMVMFTHQNPAVWADLGMILWAAGLKATAAWTISTETEAAGYKKGNYVQGTVCLVLRKRLGDEPGFLDELYPLVEDEVKAQIASMQALDEGGEPNFNDADYQLAAYAAALKVLTRYGNIDGRDVEHELFALRAANEKSDFQAVIERALRIACDYLVPQGLDRLWRDLSLVERYYMRSLDVESRGERRKGMYEELARGFGVTDIRPLLQSDKANGTRMVTPSDLGSTHLASLEGAAQNPTMQIPRRGRAASGAPHPFALSPLRHLLFAVRETTEADDNPEPGRQYLRDTFGQGYWNHRDRFIGLLEWFARLGNSKGMEEWHEDAQAARVLSGRLRNDEA
jgi:putative DNA methylase